MLQTNPPNAERLCQDEDIGLYTVVSLSHSLSLSRSVCVTPYASWVVSLPGVRGVLHFQLRRDLGLLCGSTSANSVIYCPQRARRDWQCFQRNLFAALRETTTPLEPPPNAF